MYKTIIVLVVGLVVGFGIGWLVFSRPVTSEGDSSDEVTEEETLDREVALEELDGASVLGDSTVAIDKELIEVKDQAAGNEVFISRVALAEEGWVAIEEEDANGNLVAILGARRFDGGVYQGMVRLLRATESGKSYQATLWHDDGDRAFDHTKDTRVNDVGGDQVGFSFEAF